MKHTARNKEAAQRRGHRFIVYPVAYCVLALSGCQQQSGTGPENIGAPTWPDRVPDQVDFFKHVRPILIVNCIECHNEKDAPQYRNVNLQTKQGAMAHIIPGSPEKSLFIQVLERGMDHERAMPPTPDQIWGVRKKILEKWIRDGALWPEGLVLEHPASDWLTTPAPKEKQP